MIDTWRISVCCHQRYKVVSILFGIERFSNDCRKTKIKAITEPIINTNQPPFQPTINLWNSQSNLTCFHQPMTRKSVRAIMLVTLKMRWHDKLKPIPPVTLIYWLDQHQYFQYCFQLVE